MSTLLQKFYQSRSRSRSDTIMREVSKRAVSVCGYFKVLLRFTSIITFRHILHRHIIISKKRIKKFACLHGFMVTDSKRFTESHLLAFVPNHDTLQHFLSHSTAMFFFTRCFNGKNTSHDIPYHTISYIWNYFGFRIQRFCVSSSNSHNIT